MSNLIAVYEIAGQDLPIRHVLHLKTDKLSEADAEVQRRLDGSWINAKYNYLIADAKTGWREYDNRGKK